MRQAKPFKPKNLTLKKAKIEKRKLKRRFDLPATNIANRRFAKE